MNERVSVKKIAELDDAPYPHNIEVGRVFIGGCSKPPTVGECFYVGSFRSSTVQEILSPNTFRTYNSIYEWEKM